MAPSVKKQSVSAEDKAASRASIVASLAVGETFTISEYLADDCRAEHVQAALTEARKLLTQRISSTIKFCQDKTGNVYSREAQSGMTTSGRFAVSLIIERTA